MTEAIRGDLVQVQNPRTGLFVKIDRARGIIVSHKKSAGPYKGVRIIPYSVSRRKP